jgi:tetratricopeptide (TPR) repeat protein
MLDPLQTAIAYLDPGHLEDADSICDTVLRSRPDDLARAASARQAHAPALEYLARAKNPEMSHLHVESAVAYRRSGAYSAAVEAAGQAVGLRPDVPNGYQTLAQLRYQGANYLQVLGRVRLWLKPENYLETGVEAGASLVLVRYPRVAVDVDPKPRLVTSPNTIAEILPSTSDDYLAGGDPRRDIESDGADLAFIDGQQLFEQALRDCIDTDRVAGAKTVVLIHDCLVLDTLTAQRERKTRFWIATFGRWC